MEVSILCIHTHHIFFIHSSVDGQMGCFHILAIVSNAAINIRIHVSFLISAIVVGFFFLIDISMSGIAGWYGNSIFSFWGTSILFFIVTVWIYIPTNSVVQQGPKIQTAYTLREEKYHVHR